MSDVAQLIEDMRRDGTFTKITQNPAAQFGQKPRNYLGARYLPERQVDSNSYEEDGIKYRTVLANAGTRYSPTQEKKGVLTGSFKVDLGHSDIRSEYTGQEYDQRMKLLMRSMSMQAAAQLIMWLDKTVNLPLVEFNEKTRWDAIVDASVTRVGDNGFSEVVGYSNPTGHRVPAGGAWTNNGYDPYDDIVPMVDLLHGKGYIVTDIVAGRSVISKLMGNGKVKSRAGHVVIDTGSSTLLGSPGRATLEQINMMLQADGMPPITEYNLLYRTQTGSGYFLKRDVMVFLCSTGQTASIDLGDSERLLNDTLGYLGVGVAQGQMSPGRYVRSEFREKKPQGLEAEGWQTSLPVITEPEAIGVINTIT